MNLCSISHYAHLLRTTFWPLAWHTCNNLEMIVTDLFHGELPYLMVVVHTYLYFILYLVICACSKMILNLKHVIKSVRWIKKGFFFVRHGHINYPLASSCLNDKQVYACQNLIADKELARNINSKWKLFWNRVIKEQNCWTSLVNQFKNTCFHHRK